MLDFNHFLFLFQIPYIREAGSEPVVNNGTANLGQTGPFKGDPEYSGRKKQNGSFHFISD